MQRGRLLLSCVERHANLTAGSSTLEIGTGWVHWESLILTLVSDVEATLYDVVDNRLFPTFQLYATDLGRLLDTIGLPAERTLSARAILDAVRGASSFDEVYSKLSWSYVLDECGTMKDLPETFFDFVVSSDVLEHIDRKILGTFLDRMFQLMKPGSVALHSIDLMDHLSNFDRKAPAKFYYRFDGATWDRWFNSKVQYINRVQRPEWLSMFRRAGFELVSEETVYEPHGVATVHPSYSYLTQPELDTGTLILTLRRPK